MNLKILMVALTVLVGSLFAGCGGEQAGKMADTGIDTMSTMGETGTAQAETQTQAEAEKKLAETPAAPAVTPKPKTETTKKVVADTKPQAKPATTTVQLPESTAISITLVDSIDSDIHVAGDRFTAKLAAPIIVDGKVCFEAGAQVVGVVDSVVESGRLKTPAELSFHLVSIADAGGNPMPVSTYSIYEKKAGKTGRDAAIIGGAAVVGGLIGKVTGKKGGTEIGAVAGAAAGAGAAAATGKDDIVHSAGTQITFFLAEPLSMTVPQ